MQRDIKVLTNFYTLIGADNVRHSKNTLLAHAIGVYKGLKDHGCEEAVCHAGLFHSIYGTELFQRFKLPVERRPELISLIGEYAEKLVFINCFINRASFDEQVHLSEGPYTVIHRESGDEISLAKKEFDDLVLVHLYDHLEQVERTQEWDYRRSEYEAMAERFGGIALETYHEVFTRETANT
jgi:hypothetical protein